MVFQEERAGANAEAVLGDSSWGFTDANITDGDGPTPRGNWYLAAEFVD